MSGRIKLNAWLKVRAETILNGDPLYGLAINLDAAEMVGLNKDKNFGITLGNNRARKLRAVDGKLIDKDGEQEIIVYARVAQVEKKDRSDQYLKTEQIIAWLEEQLENDPGADGALCPNATLGEWRNPVRGDALDAQPYVLAMSPLSYEEP